MFTPELWILFSFLCFIAFFGKKLYKTIVEQLDSYIKGVEQKIQEAEDLKNEALDALKEANKNMLITFCQHINVHINIKIKTIQHL